MADRLHEGNEQAVKWLLGLHLEMVGSKSYGKLIIHYQDGVLQRVIKEESHKPPTNGGGA